jgi:hypothetical protein
MDATEAKTELSRLRNRHVAKVLTHLGDPPPYIQQAIKRSFSMFADDIEANIIEQHSEHRGNDNGDGNK